MEVFKRADQDQLKEIFSQVRTVEFFFIDVLMMDIPCKWALTGVSLLQFVQFLEVTINRIL